MRLWPIRKVSDPSLPRKPFMSDKKITVTFVKAMTPYAAGDVVTDHYDHLKPYIDAEAVVKVEQEVDQETGTGQEGQQNG